MFLTQEPHDIEDFLKSVNFVAPEGMNLKYFIVPVNSTNRSLDNMAAESGFKKEKDFEVPGVTDTITYAKRQPVERNAMASANFDPTAVPEVFPTHIETRAAMNPEEDIMKKGGMVSSPVRGITIAEPSANASNFLIKESMGCFPRNTLFHFERVD